MKRLSIAMLLVLLILVAPVIALAEGETQAPDTEPQPSPEDTSQPDTQEALPASLEIDNEHIYEGMDRAYKDGYTPVIKDGIATVVIPLVASGEIINDAITVTPNLGTTMNSPFVYSNYQKTFKLQDNTVQGDTSISSFLVKFDFTLSSERVNGVYPISIKVQATDANGNSIQPEFPTYVTITDGKDPNAAEPTPKPETPTSQPKVIVRGYSINPSPVVAGEEFAAVITLKNTSETKSVQNMTVTVSCDCPNFSLQNDSNTIYIGKLKKEKTTDIEVRYNTDLETPAQRYNITLMIEYDNSEAMTLNSSGTVPITISQPLNVQMQTPKLPEQVNAGDTMPISFQVMNMGRSRVYNVRCELSAPGLIPSETAFIGNMEPGTAMTSEMNVFVGMKTMSEGYEGDEKYGYTNGVITLIYEDSTGEEYINEFDISTMISEPVIIPSSAEPEEEPEKASQWWISIVIGGIVICGLTALLIVRAKKRKSYEDS